MILKLNSSFFNKVILDILLLCEKLIIELYVRQLFDTPTISVFQFFIKLFIINEKNFWSCSDILFLLDLNRTYAFKNLGIVIYL